jgi:hypothetical protein
MDWKLSRSTLMMRRRVAVREGRAAPLPVVLAAYLKQQRIGAVFPAPAWPVCTPRAISGAVRR